MAITNPNKLIDVKELNYFRGKSDSRYATKSELQTLAEKMEGPVYDAEHRCIIIPDAMDAYYDPDSRGVIF